MRSTILLLALFFTTSYSAQWTNDPDDPLVICDATGEQRYLRVIEDGNDGWFLFWRDERSMDGRFQIYGQHLDGQGVAQWTPNGQFIHEHPASRIVDFDVEQLDDGGFLFLYGSRATGFPADSLWAMKVDVDGLPLWDGPVLVGDNDGIILYTSLPNLLASGSGALIAYRNTVLGGASQTHINRIATDGQLLHGVNGLDVGTSSNGPIGLASDENEGAYLYWRNTNGAGTHMGVMRYDDQAMPLWSAIVDPVEGTAGLGWEFDAIKDEEGGIVIVFVESQFPKKIKIVRSDGNGNQVFDPPVKTVGEFTSSQDLPKVIRHDDHFFVSWEDDRPPADNQDLYVQKLDLDGDPVWATEGVLAIQGQTYIPHGRMVPTVDGGVIATQLMSFDGFLGQRILSDGSPSWSSDFQFVSDELVPFYEEYEAYSDGLGGAAVFWYNQEDDDLYAAHVGPNGAPPTALGELSTSVRPRFHPNPAESILYVDLPVEGGDPTVLIRDVGGRMIAMHSRVADDGRVDVSSLSPGVYLIVLELYGHQYTDRLLID